MLTGSVFFFELFSCIVVFGRRLICGSVLGMLSLSDRSEVTQVQPLRAPVPGGPAVRVLNVGLKC